MQANLKQDREEMQKELYKYKRRSGEYILRPSSVPDIHVFLQSGYSSDYPTFLSMFINASVVCRTG